MVWVLVMTVADTCFSRSSTDSSRFRSSTTRCSSDGSVASSAYDATRWVTMNEAAYSAEPPDGVEMKTFTDEPYCGEDSSTTATVMIAPTTNVTVLKIQRARRAPTNCRRSTALPPAPALGGSMRSLGQRPSLPRPFSRSNDAAASGSRHRWRPG